MIFASLSGKEKNEQKILNYLLFGNLNVFLVESNAQQRDKSIIRTNFFQMDQEQKYEKENLEVDDELTSQYSSLSSSLGFQVRFSLLIFIWIIFFHFYTITLVS